MSTRSRIIDWANWWAWPGEYKPTPEELISFFEGAGTESQPSLKDAKAALAAGGTGVKIYGQTKHWCGIFACSVLRQAGVDATWSLMNGRITGKGVTSPALPHAYPIRSWSHEMRPGDIAIIRRYNHHFIVTDVDYAANQVYCVEGNTKGQIIRWAVRAIDYGRTQPNETVTAFYRVLG